MAVVCHRTFGLL